MKKRPPHQPLEIGNPALTPFVRFEGGTIYPPNDIYESAITVLGRLETDTSSEVFGSLIKKGLVHGQYRVLAEATWFALLNNFLNYQTNGTSDKTVSYEQSIRALQFMTGRPCEEAWLKLRDYLVKNIDSLSGWNASFRRQNAEEQKIFQGEDGNYYYPNAAGEPMQVIGAGTTQETRLDFIVNQLVSRAGFLRQFLGLFSIFAIADDFTRNSAHYHALIKAMLPESERGPIECDWTFLHFDYSRSYKWRPLSNLCDPGWLAPRNLDVVQVGSYRANGYRLLVFRVSGF